MTTDYPPKPGVPYHMHQAIERMRWADRENGIVPPYRTTQAMAEADVHATLAVADALEKIGTSLHVMNERQHEVHKPVPEPTVQSLDTERLVATIHALSARPGGYGVTWLFSNGQTSQYEEIKIGSSEYYVLVRALDLAAGECTLEEFLADMRARF
jgi:hypothetical protein